MKTSTVCNYYYSSVLPCQTYKKQYSSCQQVNIGQIPDETFMVKNDDINQIKIQPSESYDRTKQVEYQQKMSQVSKNQIIQNSINHNFQKHTVITIKKLTKNIASCFGYSKIEILAHQMWNIFLTSGIKSKRILVVLFGSANMKDRKYKELLMNCFFGELCNYQEELVRAAQKFLRENVVSFLTQQRVLKNIEKRKSIKLSAQFFHYFMQFVENLKRGPLTKFRIGSSTSKMIQNQIKTSTSLRQIRMKYKRKQRKAVPQQ